MTGRSDLWPAGDRTLTEEWKKNTPAGGIATVLSAQLGRPVSRKAVIGRASRLGLPRHAQWRGGGWEEVTPTWPAADGLLKEEWKKGTTFSRIAEIIVERMGLPATKACVRGRAKRLGLRRGQGWQYSERPTPAPRAVRPPYTGEMIYVPRWVLRVYKAIEDVATDGVFEGVLRMGETDVGLIGRALRHLAKLGVITSTRVQVGRRIEVIIPSEFVSASIGIDDTTIRKVQARSDDRFERAWTKAFPYGADYRVGVYPVRQTEVAA